MAEFGTAHEGWTKREILQESLDNLGIARSSIEAQKPPPLSKGKDRSKRFKFFGKT